MKKIVLTGGGTAGHVTPNIALMPSLREEGYEIHYIGSKKGIEKKLIEEQGVPYYPISSGKLRRYFDLKNISDPARVVRGYAQARVLMRKLKPDVVFSKGGFVSVPVVLAARRKRIPVIIHESDMTPGLANRLSFSSATKVCCNFPETIEHLPEGKAVLSGSPIRQELFEGDRETAKALCGFKDDKPVIMVMGGSLGAVAINNTVREILPELLKQYNVIHLCGKGNYDENLADTEGYKQYEYAKEELAHLFALTDLIISRAGANAICELLALRLPNILIPLSAAASRGDQILNARSFEKQGFSYVLQEEEMTAATLLQAVEEVSSNREIYVQTMEGSEQKDAIAVIMGLIRELSDKKKRNRRRRNRKEQ